VPHVDIVWLFRGTRESDKLITRKELMAREIDAGGLIALNV
jgi:hypothetical protein